MASGLLTARSGALLLALMGCLSSPAAAGPWTASADQRNGLPTLAKGGATALASTFVFWRENWAWADTQTELKVLAPFEYSLAGKNATLALDLAGRAKKQSERELSWELEFNARSAFPTAIGGGIAFKFDLATFGADLGEPELLPANRGWAWGRPGGARVELSFDPPPASVHLEAGKSEVRVLFYKGAIVPGQRRHSATLRLSGNMVIGPTEAERFGPGDHATWPESALDSGSSPIDLSFLNAAEKPAGKRGALQARNDQLVFEDGTPARFWGTNLTSYALFATSRENVLQQARRLSRLGFNLVRLHHHDSPWVNPNVFGDKNAPDTRTLSEPMLEKLDWWIKCLKDEGIYVWLDLHVQRELKAGDGIENFAEISHGKASADLKGYSYVNASIQEAMKRFNEAYLGHRNIHTGLRYKDDPAIAVMLITNENDVTHHFGNALLGDKGVPRHAALYMAQATAFAARHGLPKDKVWRSWEHGPSKIFLNDLEQRFNAGMIGHLRALGVKAPLVTTSTWGYNALSSLPALTAGDIIDAHSGGGVGELHKDPAYAPSLVHWLAAAQVAGKPLSVTEWGVESRGDLAPDRHVIPLYVAASASQQGWDAVMLYAYAQEPLGQRPTASIYHAYNDPGMLAILPAAALLYRQGHVREATSTYVFSVGSEKLFGQAISAASSAALRTAAERGKLLIGLPRVAALPWLQPAASPPGAKLIDDPHRSLLPSGVPEAVSDSGELRRNWEQGIFTISTPLSQAAMGWLGGKTLSLPEVEIALVTRSATVAVQSMDGKPIAQSRRIAVSAAARSVPKPGGALPFHSEPIEGRLSIAAPQGLSLHVRDPRSGAMRKIPVPYKAGRYSVALEQAVRDWPVAELRE